MDRKPRDTHQINQSTYFIQNTVQVIPESLPSSSSVEPYTTTHTLTLESFNFILELNTIYIIIGIISRRVPLKALYHRGSLVELGVRQDPDSLLSTQTRQRGQIVGNQRGD